MKILPITAVKADFDHLIDEVSNGEQITITRYGKPTAVLLPAAQMNDVTAALQRVREDHPR